MVGIMNTETLNRWRPHPWGLVFGAIGFVLGLTPSLLPRTFFYQGLICGLAAASAYGLGLLLFTLWDTWGRDRVVERLQGKLPSLSTRHRARAELILTVVLLIWMLTLVIFSLRWQRGLAELTEARAYELWEFLLVLPIGVISWAMAIILARGLRLLVRWFARTVLGGWAPSLQAVTAWALAIIILLITVEQVIPGTIVRGTERALYTQYQQPEPGVEPPTAPERSGSPASSVEWESLGQYGTRFVSQGLGRDQLTELTGRPAREPIRVYAGLDTAPTHTERARVLIDELLRTDAVSREAIVLNFTTGTGWVNPQAVQAFELLYNGDTAWAAAQYSYLPSPVHFLQGGTDVVNGGRELITPIIDWWNTLPEDTRPRLYLYGESLGSTGVESGFSGIRDIVNSVDGILLAGPPNFNPLWSAFTERRDPGTPEVQPEYSGGAVIRFANSAADVQAFAQTLDEESWGPTRVLYLQHPSDPVVWWSPSLIFREPDWLEEEPGFDRLPAMRWMPVITFLQISADLPMAQNVPDGHGHNYGASMLDGFAAIATPDAGFTVEDVEELKPLYDRAQRISGDDRWIPGLPPSG